MNIRETTKWGRKGWELNNDALSLFVMSGGGHIAELMTAGAKNVNPFWVPKWKTIDPWRYRKADSGRFGCRLLASICGHNLCFGAFGESSSDEARAGLGTHGEAPVSRWGCSGKKSSSKRLVFSYGCDLPVARLRVTGEIMLEHGSNIVWVSERISNTAKCDVPFTMCQHVTFGPPFLDPGVTLFDMSGNKGTTFPGAFSNKQRMKASAEFIWPDGSGLRGNINLRTVGKGVGSDFAAIEMSRKQEYAWFSAVNPRHGLLIAYVWRREDFPWTGIWDESFARKEKPWNGKTLARGIEFTNSPFPIGLRESVNLGKLRGQPTFRWLGARRSLTFNYSIIALPVDSDCRGVASIVPKKKMFEIHIIG